MIHASSMPCHIFNLVFNLTVRSIPIKVKSEDMSVEEMEFILNNPNYLYVGHMIGFLTCVTLFPCNSCNSCVYTQLGSLFHVGGKELRLIVILQLKGPHGIHPMSKCETTLPTPLNMGTTGFTWPRKKNCHIGWGTFLKAYYIKVCFMYLNMFLFA